MSIKRDITFVFSGTWLLSGGLVRMLMEDSGEKDDSYALAASGMSSVFKINISALIWILCIYIIYIFCRKHVLLSYLASSLLGFYICKIFLTMNCQWIDILTFFFKHHPFNVDLLMVKLVCVVDDIFQIMNIYINITDLFLCSVSFLWITSTCGGLLTEEG